MADKQKYIDALAWLERSDYDVVSKIQKGNTVQIDLTYKDKVIKTDIVMLSTSFTQYVQDKIMKLYLHFKTDDT